MFNTHPFLRQISSTNIIFSNDKRGKYCNWTCEDSTYSIRVFFQDNICICFGNALFRQNVGMSMGTNCAPDFLKFFKQIYHNELTLNQANIRTDICQFLYSDLSLFQVKFTHASMTKYKMFHYLSSFSFFYDNFPLAHHMVFILVRFARNCNSVSDFHDRNLVIIGKLLQQGYCFHQSLKIFTLSYNC